jgi:hypothetical protein|tara:strand:- start:1028 stop:1183 length:156 start_codon:yes stop_codon:yes gene_type:complete
LKNRILTVSAFSIRDELLFTNIYFFIVVDPEYDNSNAFKDANDEGENKQSK